MEKNLKEYFFENSALFQQFRHFNCPLNGNIKQKIVVGKIKFMSNKKMHFPNDFNIVFHD